MGAYRLLLAVLVAVSHMGKTFMGLNPGVVAVISFLIISGFVMTSLIERSYRAPEKIGLFYLDRALRLYPQFLFYFAASCAVIYFLLPGTPQAAELTLRNIAASLPIVPLGFYMYGAAGVEILPPAWSLGLEMCFYLVIPFLILYRARGVAFALSVAVFLAACLGFINTDLYGYRLLPGVLFMFLCGSYLYQARAKGLMIAGGSAVAAALIFVAIKAGWIERRPFNAEVTAGLALGVPAVYLLTKLGFHRIDEFLGNISYGVFLNHFVVMYLLRAFWPVAYDAPIVASVLALSLLFSGISYYCVERPALKLRHGLRAGARHGAAQGREVAA
ncbi:acyltransferase family protein [Pseudomonas chlororaphis]|uniref:acyltransferase family protein n=1 Tax=Pseudomonas chlororaphis TaxID=587753 RepID=UPI001B312878|nr:acyltransferase [Pseudomonas chlororaphis]QTT88499.1 acyltransferase [Pseudomonas chlororaphis]